MFKNIASDPIMNISNFTKIPVIKEICLIFFEFIIGLGLIKLYKHLPYIFTANTIIGLYFVGDLFYKK